MVMIEQLLDLWSIGMFGVVVFGVMIYWICFMSCTSLRFLCFRSALAMGVVFYDDDVDLSEIWLGELLRGWPSSPR